MISEYILAILTYALMTLSPGFHGERLSRAELHAHVSRYQDWPVTRMVTIFECESLRYVGAWACSEVVG